MKLSRVMLALLIALFSFNIVQANEDADEITLVCEEEASDMGLEGDDWQQYVDDCVAGMEGEE